MARGRRPLDLLVVRGVYLSHVPGELVGQRLNDTVPRRIFDRSEPAEEAASHCFESLEGAKGHTCAWGDPLTRAGPIPAATSVSISSDPRRPSQPTTGRGPARKPLDPLPMRTATRHDERNITQVWDDTPVKSGERVVARQGRHDRHGDLAVSDELLREAIEAGQPDVSCPPHTAEQTSCWFRASSRIPTGPPCRASTACGRR